MSPRLVLSSVLCVVAMMPRAQALPAAGLRGMVASAHAAASHAGVEVLRQGGNAIDAAVAAAFVLAVVEPYSSGIGGGGFALVRARGAVGFWDFREVAPAAATRDMYLRAGKPDPALARDGALAVAVPGAVAGYLGLHARFGVLPRKVVLAPAIALARAGFPVDARFRAYVDWRLELLRKDEEAARIFLVRAPDGGWATPPLGHLIVQKDLARTLETLAREGERAFYDGELATLLAADMKARGGIMTSDDLRRYRMRERAPLVGTFRGLAVASSPPPSAGGQVVLTLLNALETLPAETVRHEEGALHRYIEASKRAFADRHLLGDPDFVAAPLAALVVKERAHALVRTFGERATPAEGIAPGAGAKLPEGFVVPGIVVREGGADTTHLCTIDAAGDAVSMTTTVNYGWGAGIVARGTGIVWNDEMDDFAIAPGVPNAYGVAGAEANAVAPGKVPLSSMSPTMVFAGADTESPVRLVVGSPGGPRIPTTVVQVIMNHLVYGADVAQAVSLGRVHHQHLPDVVSVEPLALEPATRRALLARGHVLREDPPWSNATAIAVDPETGLRTGAADPRGVGTALAE